MQDPTNPFRNRKGVVYAAFLEGGEAAAIACNAGLADPVKGTTIRSWCSTWRNNPPADQPTEPKLTAALRKAAIHATQGVRIPGRAELYNLPDGRTAIMRTNADGGLMTKGGGLFKHEVDAVIVSIPKEQRSLQRGLQVYVVPLQIAKKAMAAARKAWLATNPNTSGTNDLDVISFYDRSDWLPRAVNFGVTWAEYRVADTDGPPETTPSHAAEISAHYVNEPRYRAMVDGELISAPTAEKFVGVMRINTRFSEPEPDNDTFMKSVAERSAVFGHKMRTDNAQNFIADMHATGMIELVKREIKVD